MHTPPIIRRTNHQAQVAVGYSCKKKGSKINVWTVCGDYPQIGFFDIRLWGIGKQKFLVRCLAFEDAQVDQLLQLAEMDEFLLTNDIFRMHNELHNREVANTSSLQDIWDFSVICEVLFVVRRRPPGIRHRVSDT